MPVYLPLKQGAKTPAVSGWNRPEYAGVERKGRVGMRADGLVIVDCDTLEAAKFWIELVGCGEQDWPTRTHKTPRGWHFFYRWTEGSPMGPLVGVYPGIDIRAGMGSYVVCPPTPGYRHVPDSGPNDEDFDPAWLPERTERAPAEEGWDEIPEGRRNATLVSIAGAMRKQGAGENAIATYLHGVNNTFCHPPLPAEEIVAISRSVGRYEPNPDVEIILEDDDELELPESQREDIPTGFWAEELMRFRMPEINWTVPGFLPEGLTLLAGRPKVGKSWFSLGLAAAVAEGGEFLGEEVPQGKVIYLALEDNARRLKKRLEKVLCGRPVPPGLRFETTWPQMPDGGIALARWLKEHPETRLVIVDTLAKVRHDAGERQRGTYQDDYQALGLLKRIADALGITVLVIHHQRKSEAEDILDTVSGTTGLTGAADSILVLSKDKLAGRGRDLEQDLDRPMKFDDATASWQLGEIQSMSVVEELGDWLCARLAPGDEVPPRTFLEGTELWTQAELKAQLRELRDDPRFEAVSPRHPLRRALPAVGRGV